jgi:hypothetical protein
MADAAKIIMTEGDAPATPAAGMVVMYAKTDKLYYQKDSTGNESALFGVDGTSGSSGTSGTAVLGTPQNIQISNYTTVLTDQGRHIFYPGTCGTSGTGRIWTIDSNSNVAYPVGADITFVNEGSGSAGTISILVTDDTLVLFPSGTSGTRNLAPYGIATALKIATTKWLIAGVGVI